MLISRAEYRLLLRNDNADIRLRNYGYQVGLISQEKYNKFQEKLSQIVELKEKLTQIKLTPTTKTNQILEKLNTPTIKDGISLYDLLKRPEVTINNLLNNNLLPKIYTKEVYKQVEIQIKYQGYITKVEREAQKMLKQESKQIPKNIDYNKIKNLASEARQKLNEIRPTSIGQALRISGVNPSDISILMVYLRKYYNE
jgi:tRNA uridine 5-carboxymethylaminomethyl modification enzyme